MFFPVRLAHSGWLMCTSPTILPLQLYGIRLVPPWASLWKLGPATAEQATAHVSLCFFWEGKGFYITLLRDWKQGNCRVWEVWSAQYPRPNLNPGHFRILFKITPNTLFVCMEHSYSKNLQHMGRRRDGLHDINLYERSKKTFWSHTLFIKNIFRGQEKTNITSTAYKHEQSICLFVYLLNSSVQEQTCQTINMLV